MQYSMKSPHDFSNTPYTRHFQDSLQIFLHMLSAVLWPEMSCTETTYARNVFITGDNIFVEIYQKKYLPHLQEVKKYLSPNI